MSDWLDDHPGHPLGHGYPTGSTLREDGVSHRGAWAAIIRLDPCAYCGGPGGSLDHIEPKCKTARGLGGVHSHKNYTSACVSCNGRKGANSLLMFLATNAGCRGASLKPRWEDRFSAEFLRKYSEAA